MALRGRGHYYSEFSPWFARVRFVNHERLLVRAHLMVKVRVIPFSPQALCVVSSWVIQEEFYGSIVSCFVMSDLDRFDDEKATIRMIQILALQQGADSREMFIADLKKHGVGRTAFYSSLEALEGLALVESRDVVVNGKRTRETVLTDKGMRVAEVLTKLEEHLPL